MAKKKTTDASPGASAPRRRTTRSAPSSSPVDGGLVPEAVSAPQGPISEAADAAPRGTTAMSDTPGESSAIDPTYDDIAREAYLRYLRRGGDHGRDFDDWVEAERHLRKK